MMLPQKAIYNYQFTIVAFALLTVFGISAYLQMPQTENPAITIPGASVIVVYPGAGPEDLEQLVARPIEEALNELDEIKKISSSLNESMAHIGIEFSYKTNARDKYDEVVQKVNTVQADLPDDILMLKTSKWTSTDVAILQLALTGDSVPYPILEKEADDLKKIIERTEGIKKVKIAACPDQQVRVALDMQLMTELEISTADAAQALKSYNANIPGGNINIGSKSFSLKTSGAFANLEEIGNTIVKSHEGQIIHLKDIAEIGFALEDINYKARFNGTKAVFIAAEQKEDFNIFEIKEALDPKLEEFKNQLPDEIQLQIVFDQAEKVDENIDRFTGSLLLGMLLVGLVIFAALGARSSLIVIIAIPLTVIISMGFVDLAGFGIQQITIAALVVALGLLVDNNIVIVENINRFIQNGYSPKEAATKATSQIGPAVVSSTLTTVLAFVPIILMPDKAGDYIQSLPVTVIATLTVSLLIALTLTPLMVSLFFKIRPPKPKQKNTNRLKFLLKNIIEGPYRKTLQYALKKPYLIIITALAALFISLFAFRYMGLSFFPPAETNEFMLRVHLPEGSNLEETEKAVNYAESVLASNPNVKHYASNIGHGNPRIYYTIFPKNHLKNFADIYVQLHEFNPKTFYPIIDSLRADLSGYAGAEFNIVTYLQGPPSEAPIMIYLTGKNNRLLRNYATEIESVMKNTPGMMNVENQLDRVRTDLFINIDKETAMMYGVPIHTIDQSIRTAVNGSTVTSFRNEQGDEYDVVLRMATQGDFKTEDFNKISVKSLSGKMIPLKQFAEPEFRTVSGRISRLNLQRSALITADFSPDYTLDEVLAPVFDALKNLNMPPGYEYKVAGQYEGRQDSFGGMQRAVLIALISILAVLILQFKSFKQPLIIFAAIPLAVIGSIWALFLAGLTFSFTAFIGLSGLIGIVINNSIILVDYANQLREDGKLNISDALQEAGETRFTPIILTTLTTIGGLLPLSIQGGLLWAPMGWTIIGGLLVSTMLTLIVVPVLYKVLEVKGFKAG